MSQRWNFASSIRQSRHRGAAKHARHSPLRRLPPRRDDRGGDAEVCPPRGRGRPCQEPLFEG